MLLLRLSAYCCYYYLFPAQAINQKKNTGLVFHNALLVITGEKQCRRKWKGNYHSILK